MSGFTDLPLAVLENPGAREKLVAALEKEFEADAVAYYNKYVHSRRGSIDDSCDDLDMATETPAEWCARMDAKMRGDEDKC